MLYLKDLKLCSKLHLGNIFLCLEEDMKNITDEKVLYVNSKFMRRIYKQKINKIEHLRDKLNNQESKKGKNKEGSKFKKRNSRERKNKNKSKSKKQERNQENEQMKEIFRTLFHTT